MAHRAESAGCRAGGPTRHPVIDLALARAASGSVPGQRDDGHRLGLAIASGGMRGAISGGMVTALHDLGLVDVFDAVYGSSAGAFAGAYFLARAPALGTSVYYEDLVSGDWLSYRRARSGGTLLSSEFLIDEVLTSRKPLDFERVVGSPAPLYAIATSVTTFDAVPITGFRDAGELREALRASSRIPFVAGPPVVVRGEPLVDGGIAESIPTRAALADGCTHLLVLLNQKRGQPHAQRATSEDGLMCRYLNRRIPGLGSAYVKRAAAYDAEVLALERQTESSEGGAPALYALQMSEDGPDLKTLEQDAEKLFDAAAAGAVAVHAAFTNTRPRYFRALAAVG
jgi:predicted patatin/cPLA2 family phospholipase